MPPHETRSRLRITAPSGRKSAARVVNRWLLRVSVQSWKRTPVPRPMLVATAAPVSPSSGNGPSPKIRQGSSTRLTALASHSERMAIEASPAPRKAALIRNSSMMVTMPPSMMRV